MRIFPLGGLASNNGFMIEIGEDRFQTNGFHPNKKISDKTLCIYSIIYLIIKIITIITFFYFCPQATLISGIILIFFLFTVSPLMIPITTMEHETRRWHGCEHKTAALIQRGYDITLENLKKMPRIHKDDGLSHCFDIPLSYLLLALFLALIQVNYLIILILIIYIGAGMFHPLLLSGPWQLLTTAEPKEWQLKESLQVAKLIKANICYRILTPTQYINL